MLKHLFYILSAAPVDLPTHAGAGMVDLGVPEGRLLNDSVYNNIKAGRTGASRMDILVAAEKARVLDFVWEWPEGIYTGIGEGGITLSDDQKQSVLMARYLLIHQAE
jgi:ABC-type transport system involved in Fe-S cluster assembly fused permease/ATPase subunit